MGGSQFEPFKGRVMGKMTGKEGGSQKIYSHHDREHENHDRRLFPDMQFNLH